MPRSRHLTPAELDAFGAELDALRDATRASLGQRDADYIRRIVRAVRYTGIAGRVVLMLAAVGTVVAPTWSIAAWGIGVLLLGSSKILENMELGHNVIHGQYDWMGDPTLNGQTYEWDIVGTSENWRQTHNHEHHTWTNVRGMDDDIGYGMLRIFPEQRWRPLCLLQPISALLLALFFQWGVAIQAHKVPHWVRGRTPTREFFAKLRPTLRKVGRQLGKDYVLFPLLAGPFFLPVLLGNLAANGLRNLWTYTIIFCGHFTADAETFPKSSVVNETRGGWYLRQVRGSSNIKGGRLLDVMSGNLSHQIEHHLFPDLPANRYAEMGVEVRRICARYGQHYNTGSLPKQFGQVVWRILRHSFPSRPSQRGVAAGNAIGAAQGA